MKLQFKWSALCIVATVCVVGLMAFVLPVISSYTPWRMFIVPIVLFILLFFVALCPLYLKADENKLTIKRSVGKVSIPYAKIQCMTFLEGFSLMNAFRCGSGGFFGYTGYWYYRGIGRFILYATENKKFLLVETVDKKYVIGCREPEEFIRYIEDRKTSNY